MNLFNSVKMKQQKLFFKADKDKLVNVYPENMKEAN